MKMGNEIIQALQFAIGLTILYVLWRDNERM